MEKILLKKEILEKLDITRIMRKVAHNEAFHFFRANGDPTGLNALSLIDFAKKLKQVDVKSIEFHFKRKDFEKWISTIIGDPELAKKIGRIKKDSNGEKLRMQIMRIIMKRIVDFTIERLSS